ncbi:M20 family metallopeptidase [Kribbella sp. NPDC049227]|uniref:M20 family metallopeptidase n=1 Tax=Kribbella sp. NPDC049227 TaxID=3364113 RepID=UPI00371F3D69
MGGQAAYDVVRERYEDVRSDLEAMNGWLFENPETGYEEHRACGLLADFLAGHGFEVTPKAYGLETAFRATIGSGRLKVALCAEYDALPVVGHACGHNLIATTALGAAHALAPLVGELDVTLTLYGTPGEENRGGKAEMLAAGAFKDDDLALMVHPAPVDVLDPGFLAMAHLDVGFGGVASHAAMAPDKGVNALDAMVNAYVAVSLLRQQIPDDARIHGVITEGGESANVIPAATRSEWYVRARRSSTLVGLLERVEQCFLGAAQATGCTSSVESAAPAYDDLVTDPVLSSYFRDAAARHGRTMRPAHLGEVHGSSDMGNVSKVVPTIHPLLALGEGVPNHDPRFAELTITDDGHRLLRDGAMMMAETIVDAALARYRSADD